MLRPETCFALEPACGATATAAHGWLSPTSAVLPPPAGQVLLYHQDACEAVAEEALVELADWCARCVDYLASPEARRAAAWRGEAGKGGRALDVSCRCAAGGGARALRSMLESKRGPVLAFSICEQVQHSSSCSGPFSCSSPRPCTHPKRAHRAGARGAAAQLRFTPPLTHPQSAACRSAWRSPPWRSCASGAGRCGSAPRSAASPSCAT